MNNIQENLKENITKVFEKLREEGVKGCYTDTTTNFKVDKVYPVIENIPCEYSYDTRPVKITKYKEQDKNYREYMKLLQVLERLIVNLARTQECENEYGFKEDVLLELNIIQNTMNQSLNMGFIEQYSCLVKCYETILKLISCLNIKIEENIKDNFENKDLEKDKNLRMAKYEILHGLLYKHMYNSIENDNLQTIFYMNRSEMVLKFQNIVKDKEFMNQFNFEIKQIMSRRGELDILLNNGSSIRFIVANDSARGYRCNFAVVDTNISRKMYDCVVRAKLVPYRNKEDFMDVIELNNNYYIEYADFDC